MKPFEIRREGKKVSIFVNEPHNQLFDFCASRQSNGNCGQAEQRRAGGERSCAKLRRCDLCEPFTYADNFSAPGVRLSNRLREQLQASGLKV